tara:strand:- start:656 stop:1456 length:801 start_codon:yes stop_codon:yes gene_type:complete
MTRQPSCAAGAAGIEALLAPPPTATTAADCLAALPTIVRTHYQRVDAIPWEDYDLAIEAGGPLPRGSLAADDELLMTNPSVICHQGRLLVAVRVMSPPQVQPPCTDIWRSYVVLTELTHSATAAAADGSSAPGRMLTRGCAVDVSAASVEAFGEPTGSAQQQVCCTTYTAVRLHRYTAAPLHPCTRAPVHRCTAASPAPQHRSSAGPLRLRRRARARASPRRSGWATRTRAWCCWAACCTPPSTAAARSLLEQPTARARIASARCG